MSAQSGIPRVERWIGRLLVAWWCLRNPPERSAAILREQRRVLAAMLETAGQRATKRVQIRRIPGLEQSSTNYSLAMVADHLARVNRDIAATLRSLARNEPSAIEVVIAHYKPDPSAQPEPALAALDDSIAAMVEALKDQAGIRRSTQVHAHPWFGDLPASTWACFAPFHQAIHLKQAKLIGAGL